MNKVQYQLKRKQTLFYRKSQLMNHKNKQRFQQKNQITRHFYNQGEFQQQYLKDVDQLYRIRDQKSRKSSLLVSPNFSVINRSPKQNCQDNISDIVKKQLFYSPMQNKNDKNQLKQQGSSPDVDDDLGNYIKPLKSFEKFMKTQAKNNKDPKQSRKPLDFRLTDHDRDGSPMTPQSHSERQNQRFKQNHKQLKQILLQKDKRIEYLEQQLIEMKQFMLSLKKQKEAAATFHNTQKKARGNSQPVNVRDSYEAIQQKFRKELSFLTKNNQQLYEEVQSKKQQISKLKKILKNQIKRSTSLSSRLQQVQTQNQRLQSLNVKLLKEKQAIIKKSAQQIKLVKKMKQIWENNLNCNDLQNTHVKQLQQIRQGSTSRKFSRSEIKQGKSVAISKSQQKNERKYTRQLFK